ncbi:hypothetical protein ACTXPO_13035 [Psychrobacter celer]|uniref:hypothetical protein n=1 Tax=Psychrobacter celer TaxID=306572 RepID=UPI003FD23370
MRSLSAPNTVSNHYSIVYLPTGLIALALMFNALVFSTTAQAGNSYTSDYATRSMVANPNNFKRIRINGRGVSEAVAPCPVSLGLIYCALEKLSLINLPARGVHEDYDLAQVFYYPNTGQPKTAVVIAQKTGLMDDSISGHRYRVSFQLEDGNTTNATWVFVQYGEQIQCARGQYAGRWVKQGCV